MTLYNFFKTLFLALLVLQIAPIFIQGITKRYSSLLEVRTKVAVLSINGELKNSEYYVKHLRDFFSDTKIKAILLNIECPGGASGTSQAIFNEILELKKQYAKPVIVSVENICASGGYYIACAADYIIATPSAIIASIGVCIQHPQLKEFLEQFKIKYDFTKSGKYKTAGNMFTDLTDDQKQMFQELSDNVYKQFVNDVKQRRPQLASIDEKKWADGRIITGDMAKELGLIDEIGSNSTAIRVIKEKAPIEGEIDWVKVSKKSQFWHMLFQEEDTADSKSFIDRLGTAIGNAMCQTIKNDSLKVN